LLDVRAGWRYFSGINGFVFARGSSARQKPRQIFRRASATSDHCRRLTIVILIGIKAPAWAQASWRLGKPMGYRESKARHGQPGIKLRALLLAKAGIPGHVIEIPLPRLVGRDDWVDALAALVVARRLGRGEAVSFASRSIFRRSDGAHNRQLGGCD
jgi:Protein of unknown function (DUF429)